MFSEVALDYRAGVKINMGGDEFSFSMECFMYYFHLYSHYMTSTIDRYTEHTARVELKRPLDYLVASKSVTSGEIALENIDFEDPNTHFKFIINNQEIFFPHSSNCYVVDPCLLEHEPNIFPDQKMSYLQMSNYISTYKARAETTDQQLAHNIINMMSSEENDMAYPLREIVPLILATTLIAESHRNPVCFLPSLMLIDLIAYGRENPIGTKYKWDNALQNTALNMSNSTISTSPINAADYVRRGILLPNQLGLPSSVFLKDGKKSRKKIKLDDSRKKVINAEKKYNKKSNQKEILPHEISVQMGGYFPQTHRFSYTEIEPKRNEGILTLSDKKSFVIICDWLIFKNKAKNIHKNQLHQTKGVDQYPFVLIHDVFPQLWRRIEENSNSFDLDFSLSPRKSSTIPNILKKYGCRERKMTALKVANSIWLIYFSQSSDFGKSSAKKIYKELLEWGIFNKKLDFITNVKNELKNVYNIDINS